MTQTLPPIDIHRVAAEAGVSIATVSRALNNPGRVNAKTRAHVLEVIERLGYRPNAVARGLVTGRTHIVGLVIPDVEGPLYGAMARGLEDVLSPQGLHAMIASSDRDERRELEAIGALLDRQVDGLIVVGSGLSDATLNRLERAQLPWVLMEPERQHLERLGAVNVVALDNRTGGRLAVQHLFERGCTRIAHIAGIRTAGAEREAGGLEALQARGLTWHSRATGDFTEASGDTACETILEAGRPDAMFVANDRMAAGAYRALRRHHLRVPEDISLVGFDGAPLGAYLEPGLTTMRQPAREMGRVAAQVLLEARDGHAAQSRLITPELIARESVIGTPPEGR
jgi:LacI family transcriptional regulator